MNEPTIPLELITTGSSIIVVLLIFYTLYIYKKKISFMKSLLLKKEAGNYTEQDREFVKITFTETSHLRDKISKFNKTLYPIFILIAGIFFAFFDLSEALTHINIVVVSFLYLHILKINVISYINQTNQLG